jgi:hypothetical protein
MNPLTYVKSHWHAMALGAIVWHFIGPMVLVKAGSLTGGTGSQAQ